MLVILKQKEMELDHILILENNKIKIKAVLWKYKMNQIVVEVNIKKFKLLKVLRFKIISYKKYMRINNLLRIINYK
jgi:hypothetical protein